MKIERPKIETVGFGFEPAGGAYHFVVTIPDQSASEKEETGVVTVAEQFVYGETVEEAASRARFSDAPQDYAIRPPRLKVIVQHFRWQAVAEEVRAEFNRRLLGRGQKRSAWKPGENHLAPHLGKELVLLLWAIEEANPGDIPNAVANWQGLAPEERWWLYTTINAATGHVSEGRGRGWRRAIQIAFTENPVTGTTNYFERNARIEHDIRPTSAGADAPAGRNGKRGKARLAHAEEAQTSLLDINLDGDELNVNEFNVNELDVNELDVNNSNVNKNEETTTP